MKIENVKLDENNVFVSGQLIDDCRTSFNEDVKKEWRKMKKEAKANGQPEPDKPAGVTVPATLIVDLTGSSLEDVLEYVHKPRRIDWQGSIRQQHPTAEKFDVAIRDREFTIPAVAEKREKLSGLDRIKRDYAQGKVTKDELLKWLEGQDK
jgi:hypothetical protein